MDEKEKARFKQILSKEFNDNLKDLNDGLDKYIQSTDFFDTVNTHFNGNLKDANFALKKYFQSIEYKKQFNKLMYEKNKENDEFKQKRKEYDKKYYQQNKDKLLKERKEKYHNDNEFKEQIKLKQRNRYCQLNKLKSFNLNSSGSVSGSNIE